MTGTNTNTYMTIHLRIHLRILNIQTRTHAMHTLMLSVVIEDTNTHTRKNGIMAERCIRQDDKLTMMYNNSFQKT